MKFNNNFVIRDIQGTIILFPIKKNDISDDPIYVNGVVYQILSNAKKTQSRNELCEVIVKLFSLKNKDDISQVNQCVDQLIKMGLIIEGD